MEPEDDLLVDVCPVSEKFQSDSLQQRYNAIYKDTAGLEESVEKTCVPYCV